MLNVDLLWWLLVPIALAIINFPVLARIMGRSFDWRVGLLTSVGGIAIGALILSGAFYAGKGSKTADVELLNGQVTSKARVHGSYVESYSCNCVTTTRTVSVPRSCYGSGKSRSCSGGGTRTISTTHCDTCYRDHFTVTWSCDSTLGEFGIDHLDRTSRSVYDTPDPARYTVIQNGDPVSRTHGYTNYIKAVPGSLFRPAAEDLKQRYAMFIPPYPINVYDIYKVDRVLPVGVSIPDLPRWNLDVSNILRRLGPEKQANVVIVITNLADTSYFYALQDAWQNGKKNDVIVVIGAPSFPQQASWVKVMALDEDELLQVKLRDDVLALPTLTADGVTGVINDDVFKYFKRKRMRSFQYLENEIDPPDWVLYTAAIFIALSFGGFWFAVWKGKPFN